MSEGLIEAAKLQYGAWPVLLLQVLPPLAAQIFFLSPMSTMKDIWRSGTVGMLPLLPYSMMMANGYLWVVYGVLKADNSVIAANIPSLLLGVFYTAWFLKHRNPKIAYTMPLLAACVSITIVTISWLTTVTATAISLVGLTGCIVIVLMMGGPLATIRQVISDRSTATLPFPTAAATFLNCSLWSLYGLLIVDDIFIYAPNLMGLASGTAQLCLFFKYGFNN
eukprot:TRINITY_DN18467_c0_g1_i2.p1 TRINITY_DN18467_c0_g1~~TRINITY_DN18467_c0_g1_i2.p1  ORF type:complete len:222 (+),score=33.03 TRINITY_DN18467_c0_g1_i2:77-742(+)